jgi:hypothetical protein
MRALDQKSMHCQIQMTCCNFQMTPLFSQMAVEIQPNRIHMATFFADGAKLRVACVVQNSNDVFCWPAEKTAIRIRYNLKKYKRHDAEFK